MSRRRFRNFTPVGSEIVYTNFHYTVSANNVNFFTDAGSPVAGNYNIIVDPGVILGSTSTGTASAITGIFPGALKITVLGRIQGKGGAGGDGILITGKFSIAGGGGGGGAGTDPGAGGDADPNATNGSAGTATSGGSGGTTGSQVGVGSRAATNGFPGGPALSLSMSAYIDAFEIWGGGGGGAGDEGLGPPDGGAGGGPGLPGEDAHSKLGGIAGNAVSLNGNAVTWINQTDVRGGIS